MIKKIGKLYFGKADKGGATVIMLPEIVLDIITNLMELNFLHIQKLTQTKMGFVMVLMQMTMVFVILLIRMEIALKTQTLMIQ